MVVGRQVTTAFGKLIDLLAVDAEGNLTVVELKRDRTPREVVAQVLDYASWVEVLNKRVSNAELNLIKRAPNAKRMAGVF